jgi:hypothetical protein
MGLFANANSNNRVYVGKNIKQIDAKVLFTIPCLFLGFV